MCNPIKNEFLSTISALTSLCLVLILYNLIEGWFAKFPLIIGLVIIPFKFRFFTKVSLNFLESVFKFIGIPNQAISRNWSSSSIVNWLLYLLSSINFFFIILKLYFLILRILSNLFNCSKPIAAFISVGLKLKPEFIKIQFLSIFLFFFDILFLLFKSLVQPCDLNDFNIS